MNDNSDCRIVQSRLNASNYENCELNFGRKCVKVDFVFGGGMFLSFRR